MNSFFVLTLYYVLIHMAAYDYFALMVIQCYAIVPQLYIIIYAVYTLAHVSSQTIMYCSLLVTEHNFLKILVSLR